jgi:AP endonuclease-1
MLLYYYLNLTPARMRQLSRTFACESTSWTVEYAANRRWIGAHVSAAGGVFNALHNAASIRANAFALFLQAIH